MAGDKRKSSSQSRWTEEEQRQYLKGLKLFGQDFTKIQTLVPTKTTTQIRNRYQYLASKMKNGGTSTQTTPVRPKKRKSEGGENDDSSSKKPKIAVKSPKPSGAVKKTTRIDGAQMSPSQVSVDSGELIKGPVFHHDDDDKPIIKTDLKPPAMPSALKVETPRAVSSPKNIEPKVVNGDLHTPEIEVIITENGMMEEMKGSAVISFLQREDVQTIVSGILGFVIVVALKKLVM